MLNVLGFILATLFLLSLVAVFGLVLYVILDNIQKLMK